MHIGTLLLAMLSPDPVIAPRHPHAASPWVQSVRASCGANVLAVAGYGGGRPLDRVATLRANDRPVTGPAVRRLLDDLSHRRSVYRLTILCGESGRIEFRIDEGEKQADGPVRYWSSAALVRGNRLVSYTGRQESDADSFWFR